MNTVAVGVAAVRNRCPVRLADRSAIRAVSSKASDDQFSSLIRRSTAVSESNIAGGQRICNGAVFGPPLLKADNDRAQSFYRKEIW